MINSRDCLTGNTRHPRPRRLGPPVSRPRSKAPWIIILILVVCIWGAWKIINNESTRNSPPAACQLLGAASTSGTGGTATNPEEGGRKGPLYGAVPFLCRLVDSWPD